MKTASLVLLLVASALSAPLEDAKPVVEAREEKVEPQARALSVSPLSDSIYQPYQQFGARLTPYYQPQYQYLAGQQHSYIQGTPQTYVSRSPYYYQEGQGAKYYSGAQGAHYYQEGLGGQYYQDGGYYHGAPSHFVQPANVYHTKTVVQPTSGVVKTVAAAPAAVGVHHEYERFAAPTFVKSQAAPAIVKTQVNPVPSHIVKSVGPAPAAFGVHHEYERFAAPAFVKTQAAPVPSHIVKTVASAPAAVGVHHEYERFAAPAVVRAHAAPAHIAAPAAVLKAAQPASVEPFHVIVKQANDDNFDGSFAYSYETDHGIAVESTGYVKNAGTPEQVQVMQGSYTYYTPEGVPIITTYIADENGFQVQGDHLPVAPPMPEAIARSIEYQRSLPPSAEDIAELERSKA